MRIGRHRTGLRNCAMDEDTRKPNHSSPKRGLAPNHAAQDYPHRFILKEYKLQPPDPNIAFSAETAGGEAAVIGLAPDRFETANLRMFDKECRADEDMVSIPIDRGQAPTGDSSPEDRNGAGRSDGISPDLAGVSETMLWSLHNRASEARQPDGVLTDPGSVRIHELIDYDFTGHFGDPLGSLAARAAEIDRALRSWLERHPDGCVVSLGEGLETQSRRVDNGRMHWLSVDLPDAIRLREHFLAPTHRFRHIATSALDPVWMDAVDSASGVFIVAQGLLMYLDPDGVQRLFTSIADRFPGTEIVFDTVPCWFSHLTQLGLNQTSSYRLPSMPWGINRNEIGPRLRHWHPRVAGVTFLDHRAPRGLPRLLGDMTNHIPFARHGIPSLVHVTIANTDGRPATLLSAVASEIPLERGLEENSFHLNEPSASRKSKLSSNSSDVSDADTMGAVLTAATQNAVHGVDVARATGQVIAKRVALGMAAAFDPLQADHVEFKRIIPEKVEAFSTAGMAMLTQSRQAGQQMIRLASDEVMTTARATIDMTGCSSPATLVEAQSRFARAWFSRAASSFIALGGLALASQAATMAPIRRTVVANAERLGR
jgi:O-methyltransferase involved in polyketide biosynthesis